MSYFILKQDKQGKKRLTILYRVSESCIPRNIQKTYHLNTLKTSYLYITNCTLLSLTRLTITTKFTGYHPHTTKKSNHNKHTFLSLLLYPLCLHLLYSLCLGYLPGRLAFVLVLHFFCNCFSASVE